MSLNILFVGAFNSNLKNKATSAAGDQVQQEIFDVLKKNKIYSDSNVKAIVLEPIPAWPKGPLFYSGKDYESLKVPSFLNLPVIKKILFSSKILVNLISGNMKIIFSYNPGFFESITLFFYRLIKSDVFLISIIQDVHVGNNVIYGVRSIADFFVMKLAPRFDLLIPISKCIADDFEFDPKKVLVFNGGLTRQSRELLITNSSFSPKYAVFAGALERYNGIDKIIDIWPKIDSDMVLHVFGKGSCEQIVLHSIKNCDRIVYHGFESEEVVTKWQANAAFNFCLRYSIGINARYFFPSKFFNVLAAPGLALVNRFEGFPEHLEKFCLVIADDLKDLKVKLNSDDFGSGYKSRLIARRRWLENNAEWSSIIEDALKISMEQRKG